MAKALRNSPNWNLLSARFKYDNGLDLWLAEVGIDWLLSR